MWHWLLILLLFTPLNPQSFSELNKKNSPPPASSSGATSDEEAEVLWREGFKSFESKNWKNAAFSLKRMIHRYPAHAHWVQAHLVLGQIYLKMHQPLEAIPLLKFYSQTLGQSEEGLRAKLLLGEAFIQVNQFSEAYLIAVETQTFNEQTNPSLKLDGLLLKVNALLGLNQDNRAALILAQAKSSLQKLNPPAKDLPLKAKTAWLELKIKTRACNSFIKNQPRLDESQTRKSLNSHALCLEEASLLYSDVLKEENNTYSKMATDLIKNSFLDYKKTCKNPPIPPGKRTKKELSIYKKELISILGKDCQKNNLKLLQLLDSIKAKAPLDQAKWIYRVTQTL